MTLPLSRAIILSHRGGEAAFIVVGCFRILWRKVLEMTGEFKTVRFLLKIQIHKEQRCSSPSLYVAASDVAMCQKASGWRLIEIKPHWGELFGRGAFPGYGAAGTRAAGCPGLGYCCSSCVECGSMSESPAALSIVSRMKARKRARGCTGVGEVKLDELTKWWK